MNAIDVPAGYTVADEGFEWQQDESRKGLWLVFGIGVVLVILAALIWSGWRLWRKIKRRKDVPYAPPTTAPVDWQQPPRAP